MGSEKILGNSPEDIKALCWEYHRPQSYDSTAFVLKLVEMGLEAGHPNLESVTIGQVKALAAKHGQPSSQQVLALAQELEQIAASNGARSELSQVAALVVKHYRAQADDFVVSVGAWGPDKLMGPPHTEFTSYMAIPMSDWRRYVANEV